MMQVSKYPDEIISALILNLLSQVKFLINGRFSPIFITMKNVISSGGISNHSVFPDVELNTGLVLVKLSDPLVDSSNFLQHVSRGWQSVITIFGCIEQTSHHHFVVLILPLDGHHQREELEDDVLATVRGGDVVVAAGQHHVGCPLPALAMLEVTVVRVMDPASDDDVVVELFDSPELRAPPDIVEGGAPQEDVGLTARREGAEVCDVRVTDGKYFSGAGTTLCHWLGGKYPGLGNGHDGGRIII